MAGSQTVYAEVDQFEHSRKPSRDQEPKQEQYKWWEAEEYSEEEHENESETVEKTRKADVPSWDSDISNGFSNGSKHTHLKPIAYFWAQPSYHPSL